MDRMLGGFWLGFGNVFDVPKTRFAATVKLAAAVGPDSARCV